MDPERNQEKMNVSEKENEPRRAGIPPVVVPRQGADGIQPDFDDDAEYRSRYGNEQPVGYPEDSQLSVLGQELSKRNTGNGKHEADFNIEADKYQERCVAGGAPYRSIVCEVQHQRVQDFVEPVHAPERKPGKKEIPIFPFDFYCIDIDHESEQGDDVPRKLAAVAKNSECLGRCFCMQGFLLNY